MARANASALLGQAVGTVTFVVFVHVYLKPLSGLSVSKVQQGWTVAVGAAVTSCVLIDPSVGIDHQIRVDHEIAVLMGYTVAQMTVGVEKMAELFISTELPVSVDTDGLQHFPFVRAYGLDEFT